MQEWIVPVCLGAVAALVLALVLALVRTRSRTHRELAEARAESAVLRARMDEIQRRIQTQTQDEGHDESGYVITRLGDDVPDPELAAPPGRIEGSLFADIVLRETVVKAAALVHGLRRGLAPEVRNRIRFEMRQEIKRSRRARRAELREARREWDARQRAELADEDAA